MVDSSKMASIKKNLFWWHTPSTGCIYLQDGKNKCKAVVCREGEIAKDIVAEVCSSPDLRIVPIVRPFFALCDPISLHPVSPYRRMTREDAKKQYQLRLFVNTCSNSSHFQGISQSAYSYYYKQLKEDFIQDRLFPRATINTSIWMAAIDMVREAFEKNKNLADLTKNGKEMLRYMPRFLLDKYKADREMQEKIENIFDKFINHPSDRVTVDHFIGKYLEVYEKDKMCGRHIYRLRKAGPGSFAQRARVQYLLVVSSTDGIYKTKEDDPTNEKEVLCQFEDVHSLKVDTTNVSVTLTFEPKGVQNENCAPQKFSALFIERKEMISFAVVVQTYYQIAFDVNSVILAGDLKPPEECLRVGSNDGFKRDISHGPITPKEVDRLLRSFDNMKDGNYLIRESRNMDNAYTLSLCSNQQIMNYRIVRHPSTGEYSFESNPDVSDIDDISSFKTLRDMIDYYEQTQNGLPSKLVMNISPKINPVPLISFSSPSFPSDTCSSDGSMILRDRSNSKMFDPDSSYPSTEPSSPTSMDPPPTPDPHQTPILSNRKPPQSPTSEDSFSYSNSSSTSPDHLPTVPDPSGTSPDHLPTLPDPSGTSPDHLPTVPDPSGTLPDHTDGQPRDTSLSPVLLASDTEQIPSPVPLSTSSPTDSAAVPKNSNPLIKALIEANVNYIDFNKELEIIGDLGSGNYSQVHLANWSRMNQEPVKVAVKIPMAKPENVALVKQELKREIETMAALEHPNIVRLLGISEVNHFITYIGELPVVIMEYIQGGSLRGFLDKIDKSPAQATTETFLLYGKQIAEGMKYLEAKKVVHRDLAARNVLLVKETQQVKISDFGLARQSTKSKHSYYYTGQSTSNGLPIFWYAPECLLQLKFSTKGDVWSFGVTLWEMFTRGDTPTRYLNHVIKDPSVINVKSAYEKLARYYDDINNRLPNNVYFARDVYSLMRECWSYKPQDRPSFSKLSDKIQRLLELAHRNKKS